MKQIDSQWSYIHSNLPNHACGNQSGHDIKEVRDNIEMW